jgi:hypothetical protein
VLIFLIRLPGPFSSFVDCFSNLPVESCIGYDGLQKDRTIHVRIVERLLCLASHICCLVVKY